MSVELLYTSAQQGLKQGSRGFCTVVSTAGMPLNLANRLESLSGYRHVYPPNSEDAPLNPVAFSHLRLGIGGRTVSIISRVADYGLDYSQRTNKIAHHVVLEPAELPAAGPAWLMRQPGIFRQQWDGECKTPSTGPAIPLTDQSPRICRVWQEIVGDAGWAGVVAERLAQYNGKPNWIVFAASQGGELLNLLDEAIALLPARHRWETTFSTYATMIPPDVDCRLRCVLAGTNEARMAPARGRVIDLTQPLPPVITQTTWVQLARQGASVARQSPPKIPQMAPFISPESLHGGQAEELALTVSESRSNGAASKVADFWSGEEFKLQIPQDGSAKRPPPPKLTAPLEPDVASAAPNNPLQLATLLVAAAAIVLLCLGLAAWILVRQPTESPPLVHSEVVEPSRSSTDAKDLLSKDLESGPDEDAEVLEESGQTSNDTQAEKSDQETLDNLRTGTSLSEILTVEPPNIFPAGSPINDGGTPASDNNDSEETFRYCFDKAFSAEPIRWDYKKYWEGRFSLQGTIDTKVPLEGLYWKHKTDEPPRKIEPRDSENEISILNQAVAADGNRFTLTSVKVVRGSAKLNVIIEVNILDDAFDKIINDLKELRREWATHVHDNLAPVYRDKLDPFRMERGDKPREILADCEDILKALDLGRSRFSSRQDTEPPDQYVIDSLTRLETSIQWMGKFKNQFEKLSNHQKQFEKRLKNGEPIDFSGQIFLSQPNDSDDGWLEWEPLILKIHPNIPALSTQSVLRIPRILPRPIPQSQKTEPPKS